MLQPFQINNRPGTTVYLTRCLAAVLILAALASPSLDAMELPGEGERWIELNSENFTFYSNAGQRTTQQVATDLEELRFVLVQVTDLELPAAVPIRVYVFKSRESFAPYRHFRDYQPVATAGYFLERTDADYIAIDASTREDASSLVYHEYVHSVASATLQRLPLWLEEGLAELYQTFDVTRGSARIGLPVSRHLVLLNSSPILPLEELFAVDHTSPAYNDATLKESFYAESWALVHYLLIGSEPRRPETMRFIALLREGMQPSTAFGAAFSIDLAQFEEEFRSYLRRPVFSYVKVPVAVERTTSMTVRDMTYPEVLFRLGDLLAQQSPPRPEAAEHFLAAVARDPGHGPSLAALGLLAESRARWDEAESWYRRALAAAPDDPRVQYLGGAYLLHRGADIATARDALRSSTGLAPSFAPAWAALATSFVNEGDHGDEAIEAAETAHRLLPARTDVASTLLRQYLASGRRGDAVALAARDFALGSPAQQMAFGVIARSDLERARKLVVDDRNQEALAALADAEAAVAGSAHDTLVSPQIDLLRSHIIEQQLTARYNEAVSAYNAGDLERARSLLSAMLGEVPAGWHANAVESFLAFLDEPASAPFPTTPEALAPGVTAAEVDRLNKVIAADRLDDALLLLEDLRERGGATRPGWIDLKMDEILAVRDHNRFVEAFNRAVGQFNDGAYAAAAATLEAALAEQPEAPDADAARELLAEARAALERR